MTGKGTWVDLAMYQTGVSFFGEGLLDFALNGRRTRRMGNRHEYWSPHGCYPCQGDDRWVALSVRDEEDWAAFCKALGRPELASDSRFADPLARYGHQEELDVLICDWSRGKPQDEIVSALQAQNVPAAPVQNAFQMLQGPGICETEGCLREWIFRKTVELGSRMFLGRGGKLSGADVRVRGPAPDLGESQLLCA